MLNLMMAALGAAMLGAGPVQEVSFAFDAERLATNHGTQEVYERMERRARRACDQSVPVAHRRGWEAACRADLLDQWIMAVGSPQLTALHQGANAPVYVARD